MENMVATVLLLESTRANGTSFAPQLGKRYELLVVNTGKDALSLARRHNPDVMVLDAASMRTSGDRICVAFRNEVKDIPIIHIKDGPAEASHNSVADVLLYMPFTYRKLCNRIERFTAANHGEILRVGPFCLNLEYGILTTPQGEQKLTPKLCKLMEVFLRNPGQIVERKQLIKEVWQTDYMGDTRTLDVHIRWIRQAAETDPDKPQYVKTVRGKGYRLEVPD